ncbi:3'-5' exonuclease [Streptomyces microflavus]|uniref:3'-5' exonuclease n=1 Tax=Streptomyces microflavus TaxID=1919 RepID=UPI003415CD84
MNFSSWPPLLVVDVEGNGANPPDLVEVAALPVREGRPDTSTAGAWLTKPRHPVTPFAARIHGLSNERLVDEPGWEEIADQVHTLLGTSWICAHNAHVDHRVIAAHLPTWQPAGVLDTLRLAKATHPGLPKYTLDALIEYLRPDLTAAPAHRHRATFDAHATAQLLILMADQYDTWDQLVAAAVPPGLPGAPEPEEDPTLW